MNRLTIILSFVVAFPFTSTIVRESQPFQTPALVDIAFLSDTKCVSVNQNGQLFVWDLATGKQVKQLFFEKQHWFAFTNCFAFSADARFLACGKADGTVAVFSVAQEKEVLAVRSLLVEGRLKEVAWSANGKVIAATDHETVLQVWDVQTGKEIARLTLNQPIGQFALSPDGKAVLLGPRLRGDPNRKEDLRPQLVDLVTGQIRQQFLREGGGVAFSPDGNLAAVFGERLEVWDLRDRTKKIDLAVLDLAETKDKSSVLSSVTFFADSKKLITAGMGHRVQVIDVASGKLVLRCESAGSPTWYQTRVTPGGHRIVTFARAGLVQWDAVTGQEKSRLSGNHSNGIPSTDN